MWAELSSKWVVEVEIGRRSGGLDMSLGTMLSMDGKGLVFFECSEFGWVEVERRRVGERAA